MNTDPRLHHYAQQIMPGTLEDVIEMYSLLGFNVVYRPPDNNTWAMVGQTQLRFAIQIVEAIGQPLQDIDSKRRTHIALISNNPQKVIESIKVWADKKNISFRSGGWSDIEKYFDLPDIFINFVVEVMHTSIEEK